MKDLIRVASAVIKTKPGNVKFNLGQVEKQIESARENKVKLLVFPELCLTGYSCGDLFFTDVLTRSVTDALEQLKKSADGIAFAVGAPFKAGNKVYDCAFMFADKKITGIVPKIFPRDYAGSNQSRYFSSPADTKIKSADICGESVNFGAGLIFEGTDGIKIGIEIGNNSQTPVPPASVLALGGANIILNMSAEAAAAGINRRVTDYIKMKSSELAALYVYSSVGYEESTSDCVFTGQSVLAMNGRILAENKNFTDSDYIITADADIGVVMSPRTRKNDFYASEIYTDILAFTFTVKTGVRFTGEQSACELLKPDKYPFIPDNDSRAEERARQLFEIQSRALAQRLKTTSCRPVIGVSGGLDSTLALLVAVNAVEMLGRSADNVLGITMPCFGTSGDTLNNSHKLMDTLRIESRTVNIGDSVLLHLKDIGHGKDVYDAAYENAQARERTQVLMDISNSVGGIVVGTGDLSELALGWCTYNGDQMSMYAVNSSLPKTLIKEMVRRLAHTKRFEESRDTLLEIVGQPISPELLPPDAQSGKIAQKTEDLVGPYELHDFFIYYAVRYGYEPQKIYDLAKCAFKDDYDGPTIKKWLVTFVRRFFSQQFKRSCSPDSVLTGSVFLSPKYGWNMPSDINAEIYRQMAENIKI